MGKKIVIGFIIIVIIALGLYYLYFNKTHVKTQSTQPTTQPTKQVTTKKNVTLPSPSEVLKYNQSLPKNISVNTTVNKSTNNTTKTTANLTQLPNINESNLEINLPSQI